MRIAWLSPALDRGGGHISHALALVRALQRATPSGSRPTFAVFGPTNAQIEGWIPCTVPSTWDDRRLLDPVDCLHTSAGAALAAWKPDVVLVDLMWLPTQALVQQLGVPAWLMVRDVPTAWLHGPAKRPFQPDAWDRLLAIEPWRGRRLPQIELVPPLVTTNPSELLPPSALAERTGVARDRPIHLIAQTGQAHELAQLRTPAPPANHAVLELSMHTPDALVPLAPWLAGAHTIVGGAGYNLFWETRWLGLEDRTRLLAFPRNNDDQAWRLAACRDVPMHENGADRLAAELLALSAGR